MSVKRLQYIAPRKATKEEKTLVRVVTSSTSKIKGIPMSSDNLRVRMYSAGMLYSVFQVQGEIISVLAVNTPKGKVSE